MTGSRSAEAVGSLQLRLTLAAAKRDAIKTRSVVLSAHVESGMVYRAVANGAAGYLSEAVACDEPVAVDNKLALAIDRHDADQELHERNREMRNAVSALHPVTLERGGLQSAIDATADFHAMKGGFETTVEVAREAPGIQDQLIVSLARERLALTSGWRLPRNEEDR
ncbi:MAG: hypothetical protein M3Y09_13880 [Actinomycetota bacterium]|nr:hypothetical protein [Actinomycetota bacterium]